MLDYQIVSADSHIIEPPDLWEKWLTPEFRQRAPGSEQPRPVGVVAAGRLGAHQHQQASAQFLEFVGVHFLGHGLGIAGGQRTKELFGAAFLGIVGAGGHGGRAGQREQ